MVKAFICILFLSSCSLYPKIKSSIKLNNLKVVLVAHDKSSIERLEKDLTQLSQYLKEDEELAKLFKNIRYINIAPNNCRVDELACVFTNDEERIYLKDTLLKKGEAERLSTIVHEAAHFKYGVEHIKCIKRKGNECDATKESSYGIELFFLQRHYPEAKSLLNKIKSRINFL